MMHLGAMVFFGSMGVCASVLIAGAIALSVLLLVALIIATYTAPGESLYKFLDKHERIIDYIVCAIGGAITGGSLGLVIAVIEMFSDVPLWAEITSFILVAFGVGFVMFRLTYSGAEKVTTNENSER